MREQEWPPGALAALIDHMAEAVALLDAQGRVLSSNAALSLMSGYTAEEWRGGTLARLLATHTGGDSLAAILARAVEHGSVDGEAHGDRRDGSTLWIRYRLVRLPEEAGYGAGFQPVEPLQEEARARVSAALPLHYPLLLVVAQDISREAERQVAQDLSRRLLEEACHREETLTCLNRQLTALNELAATVNHSLDLETVLDAALDCSLDVAEASTGWVTLLATGREELLELVAHRGLPEECVLRHGRTPVEECMAGKAVVTGKPFVLYSLPLDDGLTPYLRSQEVRCVAYIPLLNRDRTIGALGIGSSRFHQFSASQVRFLTAVGHQVGLAIGNARLYEQVKQRAETDPLTCLYNRQRFCELLDQRLAAGRRLVPAVSTAPALVGAGLPAASRSLAGDGLSPTAAAGVSVPDEGPGVWEPFTPEVGPWVLMIDIDNFKQINDTRGHARGDQALRDVAHLLRQSVRAGDILGRFGGDEFVVALCDDNRAGAGSPQGWAAARAVVRRLRRRFAEASAAGEFCVPLTVSIGAARSGTSSEHCLQLADEAMYREKRRRKRKAA